MDGSANRWIARMSPEAPDGMGTAQDDATDYIPGMCGKHLVLTTNIPHGEADVLVLDCLDVEACDAQKLITIGG